jgi:hypothetical protein
MTTAEVPTQDLTARQLLLYVERRCIRTGHHAKLTDLRPIPKDTYKYSQPFHYGHGRCIWPPAEHYNKRGDVYYTRIIFTDDFGEVRGLIGYTSYDWTPDDLERLKELSAY